MQLCVNSNHKFFIFYRRASFEAVPSQIDSLPGHLLFIDNDSIIIRMKMSSKGSILFVMINIYSKGDNYVQFSV